MKFKVKLLEFDKQITYGRMYNKDMFIQSLGELNHTCIRQQNTIIGEITHNVSHISIDSNNLYADIEVLDKPNKNLVQEVIKQKSNISVKPIGSFNVNNNGEITDYVLNGFNIEL